jgi:hypothetical protein
LARGKAGKVVSVSDVLRELNESLFEAQCLEEDIARALVETGGWSVEAGSSDPVLSSENGDVDDAASGPFRGRVEGDLGAQSLGEARDAISRYRLELARQIVPLSHKDTSFSPIARRLEILRRQRQRLAREGRYIREWTDRLLEQSRALRSRLETRRELQASEYADLAARFSQARRRVQAYSVQLDEIQRQRREDSRGYVDLPSFTRCALYPLSRSTRVRF